MLGRRGAAAGQKSWTGKSEGTENVFPETDRNPAALLGGKPPPLSPAPPLEAKTFTEETGDEVILMKDKTGKVIGFEKLNFVQTAAEPIPVAFEMAVA